MPSSRSRIILSRFFNNNVKLVADMCTRCYEESEDVKIVSVNVNFLKQTNNFKYLLDKFDFLTVGEFGFSRDEIELSLKHTEAFNDIINKRSQTINKIEETFKERSERLAEEKSFKGFSADDIKYSTKDQTKLIKARNQIRLKVYQRTSMRILKNILSKSSLNKKKCKGINDKREGGHHSKYFSTSLENNNVNIVETKTDNTEIENIKVEVKCEHCKVHNHCTCPENCASEIKLESQYVDYESQYFKPLKSLTPNIKSETRFKKYGFEDEVLDKETPVFVPPKSPHNLIEERLYHDPWALLVATIFLNRTSCMCARPYVFWFLNENPDPLVVLDKYPKELERYFVKLGLQRTRAVQVWRMSHDFVYKKWNNVNELYGIGRYGENAFRMFCLGDFSVEPEDRFLRIYKAWYQKVALKEGLS